MTATEHIIDKYQVKVGRKMPVWLPIGRNALAPLFVELGYKVGAEIGVARGRYAEVLCKAGLKVYAIDAYTAYEGYEWHTTQQHFDGLFEEARARLASYDHQLIRCFSLDALKLFRDNSLDFAYVDANHEFVHMTNDLDGWVKKVRPGGIICGHDFARYRPALEIQVKDAVLGYTYAKHIRPWFVTRKRPSWLWEKE